MLFEVLEKCGLVLWNVSFRILKVCLCEVDHACDHVLKNHHAHACGVEKENFGSGMITLLVHAYDQARLIFSPPPHAHADGVVIVKAPYARDH